MILDKSSYIPMSRQIFDIICFRIISGVYKVGEYIPSQSDLADEFEVSMITIRQAFNDLSSKGIINSHKGKGTMIAEVPSSYDGFHTEKGFTADSKFSKFCLDTKVLNITNSYMNDEIKKIFSLSDSNPILISRLRILNNIKASVEYSYLNPNLLKDTDWENEIQDNISLYEFIKNKYGFSIERAEEKILAVLPPREVKELLDLKQNIPIFFIKRFAFFSGHSEPFEYCQYYLLSEYYGSIEYNAQNKANNINSSFDSKLPL